MVEASTDNGTSWTRLTPIGGYPGTINQGGTLCGIAQGSGAFTGTGHFSWSPYQIDLAAYAGHSVKLRWLYRTDGGVTGEGWFVDDIQMTHDPVAREVRAGDLLDLRKRLRLDLAELGEVDLRPRQQVEATANRTTAT